MSLKNISSTGFTLLPALALIPIFLEISKNLHPGGANTIIRFFASALNPSLNPIILQNAWQGLKVTFGTALISWFLSLLIGIILGVLSSNVFWEILTGNKYISFIIKRLLSIPRSIHEVVWGLFLLQVLGLSPLVAIIAIIIPYSCLMAKVVANQLDILDRKNLIAIIQNGSSSLSALITAIIPPIIPVLKIYGYYRLECAIRGAVLLGVFGMGGIGTELQLTLQSLQFNELWTSLWILGTFMFLLESFSKRINDSNYPISLNKKSSIKSLIYLSVFIIISILSINSLDINLYTNANLTHLGLPQFIDLRNSLSQLPMIKLIFTTLILTLLSSGIAIGIPPLTLFISTNKLWLDLLSLIWLFCRIMPPPLTALLLLLCSSPNISIAALALAISNIGVLGRILKENVEQERKDSLFDAVKALGASNQIAWLYGKLSPQSNKYLAFGAYRADVLLRETALVGVVGGVGLGWKLQESLYFFQWSDVIVITTTFATITIIIESICERIQQYWLKGRGNSYKGVFSSKLD